MKKKDIAQEPSMNRIAINKIAGIWGGTWQEPATSDDGLDPDEDVVPCDATSFSQESEKRCVCRFTASLFFVNADSRSCLVAFRLRFA